jgi:hypothetical protein
MEGVGHDPAALTRLFESVLDGGPGSSPGTWTEVFPAGRCPGRAFGAGRIKIGEIPIAILSQVR